MFGAYITSGLTDWQIIQQENGIGRVTISGKAVLPDKNTNMNIILRAVREDNAYPVTTWQYASKGDIREDESGALSFDWVLNDFAIPAGGLYRIECGIDYPGGKHEWAIRGEYRYHIGVGDLYVITGQSNSAGYGHEPVNDPPELGVHLFKNSECWDMACHPMNDFTNAKHSANLETANPGHSPYLSFGKYLKHVLGYPIGLIQTSLGGSPLSAWNPAEEAHLYKNMMNIINLAGGKIAGVLWYQGCSDAYEGASQTYAKRFINFANTMRNDLCISDLPYYTVQLNCHCAGGTVNNLQWSIVREAQRVLPHMDENIHVVPTLDLGLNDEIHTSSSGNVVLGERLARLALQTKYHTMLPATAKAPDLISAKRDENGRAVTLTFANAERIDCFGIRVNLLSEMYLIKDEQGEVALNAAYGTNSPSIRIDLARPLAGKATITIAPGNDPQGAIPFDGASWLPVLAFHEAVIE